jgi:hypothetical protein
MTQAETARRPGTLFSWHRYKSHLNLSDRILGHYALRNLLSLET